MPEFQLDTKQIEDLIGYRNRSSVETRVALGAAVPGA